jgi:hypothetical protein
MVFLSPFSMPPCPYSPPVSYLWAHHSISIVPIVLLLIHSFTQPTCSDCLTNRSHTRLPLFLLFQELRVICHSHGHSSIYCRVLFRIAPHLCNSRKSSALLSPLRCYGQVGSFPYGRPSETDPLSSTPTYRCIDNTPVDLFDQNPPPTVHTSRITKDEEYKPLNLIGDWISGWIPTGSIHC